MTPPNKPPGQTKTRPTPDPDRKVCCPLCGFYNQPKATICQGCQADLRTGTRPKQSSRNFKTYEDEVYESSNSTEGLSYSPAKDRHPINMEYNNYSSEELSYSPEKTSPEIKPRSSGGLYAGNHSSEELSYSPEKTSPEKTSPETKLRSQSEVYTGNYSSEELSYSSEQASHDAQLDAQLGAQSEVASGTYAPAESSYSSEKEPEETKLKGKSQFYGGSYAPDELSSFTEEVVKEVKITPRVRCPACGFHNRVPVITCRKCLANIRTGERPNKSFKSSQLTSFYRNFKKYKTELYPDNSLPDKPGPSLDEASLAETKTKTKTDGLLRCPLCGFHNKAPARICQKCQADLYTGWLQHPAKKIKFASFYKNYKNYQNELYGDSPAPEEPSASPATLPSETTPVGEVKTAIKTSEAAAPAPTATIAIAAPTTVAVTVAPAPTATMATVASAPTGLLRCPACGFHNKLPATICQECRVDLRTGMPPKVKLKSQPQLQLKSTARSASFLSVLTKFFIQDSSPEPASRSSQVSSQITVSPQPAPPKVKPGPSPKKQLGPGLRCPICGLHNKLTAIACQRCQADIRTGVPQVKKLKALRQATVVKPKSKDGPKKSSASNTVRCPVCEFHNKLPATICQRCQADIRTGVPRSKQPKAPPPVASASAKPPPKKSKGSANTVRCPFCGFHNKIPVSICQQCDVDLHTGMRPQKESLTRRYFGSLFKNRYMSVAFSLVQIAIIIGLYLFFASPSSQNKDPQPELVIRAEDSFSEAGNAVKDFNKMLEDRQRELREIGDSGNPQK